MPFPFADLVSEARSVERTLEGGGFERRWSLVRGDYERSEGTWRVLPWGEESARTLLIYQQDAKPKMTVPEMLLETAQKRTLPKTFHAIRLRVATPDVAAGP